MMYETNIGNWEPMLQENKITLDEWFSIWMEEYKMDRIKLSSVQTYQTMYQKQIKNDLGSYPISEIRPFHLQKVYNALLRKQLSSGYLRCIHAMLHNLFQIAVNNDLIIKNPCAGVTLPANYSEVPRVLSLQEQQELLRFLEDDKWSVYQPMITIMLGTGLRVGELLALTWQDVDFCQRTISVSKSLAYIKDMKNHHYHFCTTPPKTRSSCRSIPMSDGVLHSMEQQRKWLQKRKGMSSWQPIEHFENLVFPNKYGHPQQRGAVQRILKRIVNAMNERNRYEYIHQEIDWMPPLHPHTLRHSFATRCFEAGIPAKTVQMLLGHKSIQLTMDIYTHVSEEKKKVDMEKLNQIL